jgi:putative transposase
VKAGDTPGYPRFKGRTRFNSFLFKQYGTGVKIDGRKLKLFGIGRVSVRWHTFGVPVEQHVPFGHRPIDGEIKTVRILHKAGKWYAVFACLDITWAQ